MTINASRFSDVFLTFYGERKGIKDDRRRRRLGGCVNMDKSYVLQRENRKELWRIKGGKKWE
jgi:hypothetical protein